MTINQTSSNNANTNIGFIGGGNMAQALIGGLLAQEHGTPASQIMVSDPSDTARSALQAKGVQTTTDSMSLLEFADVVVLAIKPQLFEVVLAPLAGKFTNQLIISVAAGVTMARIGQLLGGYDNIVRCMPNTPALIQTGATGLFAHPAVPESDKATAERILAASGLTLWVDDEELMHAVTAISGSAPAYFFYFAEHMIAAGQDLGLSAAQSKSLAMQTALGAAKMLLASDDTPAELRRKVTSPNGTTQAAIEHMQAHKVGELIEAAMHACDARSRELAAGG